MVGIMWFSLLIPLLLIGVLMVVPKFRRMTKWWEVSIPLVITVLVTLLCQWLAVRSATSDEEYWGHMSYKVVHEEPASYDGECVEMVACGQSCDAKGNCTTNYCPDYYHCVKSDGRSCYIVDDRGNTYRISYGKFKEIAGKKRWNWHKHTETAMKRYDGGYTTIGDLYKRPGYGSQHIVHWNKDWTVAEPIVREYTYENRLQTQSHWGKVTDEEKVEYDVFEYPSVPGGWRLTSVLTNGPAFRKTDKHLQYLNGWLNTRKGGYKKVRLWLLVYNGKSQESAELQRSYWKGGNKNEIVIMIGTNASRELTWADIMTQADDSDTLMVQIRDQLLLDFAGKKNGYSGKVTDKDLFQFVKWLGPAVKAGYTKPDFRQYKYIQVQPSATALIISYSIILLVNIAAGFFVVLNPWYDSDGTRRSTRRRGRYRYR